MGSAAIQEILLKYYRDWLFNTPEMAERMVARALSIATIHPPGQILDIGCGLGYHAIAFAQKGFQVSAFDPGSTYLEIARRHIDREGVDVTLLQMKCAGLNESERFVLAWAGSYCPGQLSPSEVAQDFKRIYRSLKPGGWFISNVAGKPRVPPSEKVRHWRQLSDCFALFEKWADETYFHEHCWFVYPDTNKVIKFAEVERMYGVKEIPPLWRRPDLRIFQLPAISKAMHRHKQASILLFGAASQMHDQANSPDAEKCAADLPCCVP